MATTLLWGANAPAQAPASLAGAYRAQETDTASMIELTEDGQFRYQLSEGALDEYAEGRWTRTTTGAELETLPHPKSPQFSLGPVGTAPEAGFSLKVIFEGRDVEEDGLPGVDFRVGFSNGEVAEGYTQRYGWAIGPEDPRQPIWVELYEPINDLTSQRIALPDQRRMAVNIILTANDIGVAAFDHTPVSLADGALILHWRGRDVRYVRMSEEEKPDE